MLRCYFFACESISTLCRCVYLQLLAYGISCCEHCGQRVSIGVFIYSQNQADYDQGNACSEAKNLFYDTVKGSSRLGEERQTEFLPHPTAQSLSM